MAGWLDAKLYWLRNPFLGVLIRTTTTVTFHKRPWFA